MSQAAWHRNDHETSFHWISRKDRGDIRQSERNGMISDRDEVTALRLC